MIKKILLENMYLSSVHCILTTNLTGPQNCNFLQKCLCSGWLSSFNKFRRVSYIWSSIQFFWKLIMLRFPVSPAILFSSFVCFFLKFRFFIFSIVQSIPKIYWINPQKEGEERCRHSFILILQYGKIFWTSSLVSISSNITLVSFRSFNSLQPL